MTSITYKLGNAFLYPKTTMQKLVRLARQRLDPDWLVHLEQGAASQVQWISPKEIHYISQKRFSANEIGQVVDGEWDTLNLPFDQFDAYQEKNEVLAHSSEPLLVNIGRHGDYLLNEGEQALALAKREGWPRIPVTIRVRHAQWVRFKHELIAFARQQPNGAVYAPLLHPDLAWVPAHRDHERFNIITQALASRGGTMLDIGCNLGYFCHRFEDMGFTCTGIELDPTIFYFLEKLKRASNKSFQIINTSIFDYMQQEPRQYDVVLALAVFHHFTKSEELLHQLKNLLARLNTRELYFQPPHTWDPQMRGAYWNPSPDEFIAFILEHSPLKQVNYLGRQSGGRPFYRFTI